MRWLARAFVGIVSRRGYFFLFKLWREYEWSCNNFAYKIFYTLLWPLDTDSSNTAYGSEALTHQVGLVENSIQGGWADLFASGKATPVPIGPRSVIFTFIAQPTKLVETRVERHRIASSYGCWSRCLGFDLSSGQCVMECSCGFFDARSWWRDISLCSFQCHWVARSACLNPEFLEFVRYSASSAFPYYDCFHFLILSRLLLRCLKSALHILSLFRCVLLLILLLCMPCRTQILR